MLPKPGRMTRNRGRGTFEAYGGRKVLYGSEPGVFELNDGLAVKHLGIFEKRIEIVYRREGHALCACSSQKLMSRKFFDLGVEKRNEFQPIFEALDHFCEARIPSDVGSINDPAEPRKLIVLDQQTNYMAVGGFPGSKEVGPASEFVAERGEGSVHHRFRKRERREGIDHGDLDALAKVLGIAFAREKRGEHTRKGSQCARLVGDGALDEGGCFWGPLFGHEARQALKDLIVGGEIRVRAVAPEPVDGEIDQARVDGLKGGIPEIEFFHDARPEIFNDDIDLGKQVEDELASAVGFEIHHDAPLVPVELSEEARESGLTKGRAAIASRIAGGGFDLDHVCSHITEGLGAERTRDHGCKVKNS